MAVNSENRAEFMDQKNKIDDKFIDLNLKQEVKTEIDDFYIGEYTREPTRIIRQKRKNTEELYAEIYMKKIKQEVAVFEESSDVIVLNTPNSTKKHVNIFLIF